MSTAAERLVLSPDGVPIAVFSHGAGPPLVLVHGAAADHTTFRVIGPMLAERHAVHEVDRRGRGASGDATDYGIEREYADLATVAEAVAADAEVPKVDIVGHSFGGRIALGAALRTDRIGRLVVYEGAPPAAARPYRDDALVARLRALADRGRDEELLETFLAEVVGMSAADLAAYRANPVWPARVAAAPTIVRELEAEGGPAAGLETLGRVRNPVLQVLGGASLPAFGAAVRGLDARLGQGRIAVIEGARHAAHHTHPDELVARIEEFLRRGS